MTDAPQRPDEIYPLMWWSPQQHFGIGLSRPCIGVVAVLTHDPREGDCWRAYMGIGYGDHPDLDAQYIAGQGAGMVEAHARMFDPGGRYANVPYRH